jgi:hypothetical protein
MACFERRVAYFGHCPGAILVAQSRPNEIVGTLVSPSALDSRERGEKVISARSSNETSIFSPASLTDPA